MSVIMPIGCVVKFWAERMSGGEPIAELWNVCLDDGMADPQPAAIAAVRKKTNATPDEIVEVVGELTIADIKGLGLQPGDVKSAL
jgi:hypothetical protein